MSCDTSSQNTILNWLKLAMALNLCNITRKRAGLNYLNYPDVFKLNIKLVLLRVSSGLISPLKSDSCLFLESACLLGMVLH